MQLSYVSIENYRSITNAHKIEPSNLTVLVGKNNEGKSNIVKAIALGMDILEIMKYSYRNPISLRGLYDWCRDFPIDLQNSNKLKNKNTKIRFDFLLNSAEIGELYDIIGSNINGELSIFISINEQNKLSVTVPKRGKNARALSSKITLISRFICEHFEVQYIPAIRSEDDAISVMSNMINTELENINDEHYNDCLEYIQKKQSEIIDELSRSSTQDLKKFLPQIKSVQLQLNQRKRNYIMRSSLNVIIDDGVKTNLSYKGDGVKSLATIALLSSISTNKDRLIIVDEPENNLHSGAVRYINGVLYELSRNNQVILSTHEPIFINRSNVSANWIVDLGQALQAKRLDEIRDTLGVMCSDNLMYSDYVIVVEGLTDRDFLLKVFESYPKINKALKNHIISIRTIAGVNNLSAEVYSLQRYCCNYLILLDYDEAAKNAVKTIKDKFSISDNTIRYFMKPNKKPCELEDLFDVNLYKNYLFEKGIDVENDLFKNNSKKWSDRISDIASAVGMDFSSEMENECKQKIQELFSQRKNIMLTSHAQKLIDGICEKIEQDIEKMYCN